jgi:hypothetical protein
MIIIVINPLSTSNSDQFGEKHQNGVLMTVCLRPPSAVPRAVFSIGHNISWPIAPV